MGGWGSGRTESADAKRILEEFIALDLRALYRQGLVPAGSLFLPPGMYDYFKRVKQSIPLTWTACHYGGERPWFLCPGLFEGDECGKRVACLYSDWNIGALACRQCHNLIYTTQKQGEAGWAFNRAWKIRQRVGGLFNTFGCPLPAKPPRMRWSTYERLMEEVMEAEIQGMECQKAEREKIRAYLRMPLKG